MSSTTNHTRRFLLLGGAGLAAIAWMRWPKNAGAAAKKEVFEVQKTDIEWRRILTQTQYEVLRREGTEPPGSSPLDHEKRKGTYACAGCDLPLFSSETKFDSGTGWPSFYKPLPDAVRTKEDHAFFMVRTEVHCRRCGGHLGHVFDDGPPPTGLRYCMNGVALKFIPAQTAAPPA
jgi:peptide-methionine (R)-S-oxide reductase